MIEMIREKVFGGIESKGAQGWCTAFILCLCTATALAGETDQYLSWDVELADSAPALNTYINEEAANYLELMSAGEKPCECEELAAGFYKYLFKGIHSSRLRKWLYNSEEVERYPDTSISDMEYQNMSIYRVRTFPWVLPMARTIRIGDVYLGTDKISHFFGFGRRYYQWYQGELKDGLSEEDALDKVLRRGIRWERSMVGQLMDGIFSKGDVEANYQGFRLARTFCEGSSPVFAENDGMWTLSRPIDLRPFVTPGFDESYNHSYYGGSRRMYVVPILEAEYAEKINSATVQARFAAYADWEQSPSMKMLDDYFSKKSQSSTRIQPSELFALYQK